MEKNSLTSSVSSCKAEIAALHEKIPQTLLKDRAIMSQRLAVLDGRYQKGGDITLPILKLADRVEKSCALRQARLKNVPALTYPKPFPILEKKAEILAAIEKHPVIIVVGETGSGKTTQLPKFCLEAGRGREGKIGCTQPRRVAATSVSRYLATQVQGQNHPVSYKIRFQTTDSDYTYIKLMTDGVLLAETQNDQRLYEYDTLIIDEAHERSLNIDFILGYLKKLQKERPDLKIIVSSATMDVESFARFFDNPPIIEVSGRTYPVTVRYEPIPKELEEAGDVTMIDMAIDSTRQVMEESGRGDILIFMPTEADIRETIERLRGATWCTKTTILPLFSRLTVEEQTRIFDESEQRKIVVATNIAETSITIPGIRYVIDTGYARLSRYCPRTKTKRLPIEFISRSSAEQRKGRCGRVEEGVCVRLYAEEEFLSREQFTPPEIKRADLAEVILRMLALSLGDIEIFPLVDPPSKAAIRDGINTLRELGAITQDNRLTELGRSMAQLPTDPRTARILLAAREENVLSEVLIIASVLSLQDPRERPYEKQGEADLKHRQFAIAESDFLSYLNLWKVFHETCEKLKTQSKIRKFCRENFLSFPRMHEWDDLHSELTNNLKEQHLLKLNHEPAGYAAIHKAILSGFLGNLGQHKEQNLYTGRQGLEFMIFPGSGQFGSHNPWIVAAELVETSRLYARTVAKIEEAWVEPLARDLCHYTYHEPHFDKRSGQVVAYEKVTLWGLVLIPRRRIHYGKINRAESRQIFIEQGLVPFEIEHKLPFMEKNKSLIATIGAMEDKIRKRIILADTSVFVEFYDKNLPDVVNLPELKEFLEKEPAANDRLTMTPADILRKDSPQINPEEFPDYLLLGSQQLRLSYHFAPDSLEDGLTLLIPEDILPQLTPEPFEWLVPGMLLEKLTTLLKSLEKELRRQLVPLPEKAEEMARKLPRTHGALLSEVEKFLRTQYNVKIVREDWQLEELPPHLFMRFAVISPQGKILDSSRNLRQLQGRIQSDRVNILWDKAHKRWFLPNLRNWCFNELPDKIEVTPQCGSSIPHLAYPGLEIQNGQVNRTLFVSQEEAEAETKRATGLLLEFSLRQELLALERAMFLPQELAQAYLQMGWSRNLAQESYVCLKSSLLDIGNDVIRGEAQFVRKRQEIQTRLLDIISEWTDLLDEILDQYLAVEAEWSRPVYKNGQKSLAQTVAEAKRHLQDLLPPKFLLTTSLDYLLHYPRYLKGIAMRLSRAAVDPARDRKKWDEVAPHLANWRQAQQQIPADNGVARSQLAEYRWLLEELQVSIFAQELKTACPVSGKRLTQKWEEVQKWTSTSQS